MHNTENLEAELQLLYETQCRISKIIEGKGLRFSINKITADLGEYYAYLTLAKAKELFESISQESQSNSDFDLIGIPTQDSIIVKRFSNSPLKIEVKTRRNQKGAKYLSSVKPNKFDILCVVDIAIDYSLKQVFLVDGKVVEENLDIKRGRLKFNDSMSFYKLGG